MLTEFSMLEILDSLAVYKIKTHQQMFCDFFKSLSLHGYNGFNSFSIDLLLF